MAIARIQLVADRPRSLNRPPFGCRPPYTTLPERAGALAPGEILRVDSAFRPAPLVEALAKQGFRSFVRRVSPGRFETFLTRG